MKTIIHVTRKLTAFAALTLICATASASPPGTGGGTMYYTYPCCRSMWSMNSDGTNQTHLGIGTYGPPSMSIYAGFRYFLHTMFAIPQQFYPNGDPVVVVVALRSDYDTYTNDNSTTKVELTNDITLQPQGDGLYSDQWVPGNKISFKAPRWSGSTVSEAGIYTATLQFGADGSIIGLVAQPTSPAIAFPLDANQWPNVRTYGWDPSGTKVAYDDTATLGIADIFGNPHQIIYNRISHTPQWSPDGNTIAFTNANVAISTIKPNGAALKEIIRRTNTYTFDRPFFSPTGSHIVCYGFAITGDLDIFRATASGGSLTNLTNTPSTAEMSMGWR
jgi:hypothetical protein